MTITRLICLAGVLSLFGCANAIDDYIDSSTVTCTEDALACYEPAGLIDLCCDSDETMEWCWFEAPGEVDFACEPVTKGLSGEAECDDAYAQLQDYCQP